jgi:hypothetical protein
MVLFVGLVLGAEPVAAQDTGSHQVGIQAEPIDDIETGEPPPPVSISSGGDGTAESTLTIRTNAPPSNPRTVEAYLEAELPEGFILKVDVLEDETVDGHVELSTDPATVMTDVSAMSMNPTLEYQITVTPNVRTTETTATVTYTMTEQ